MNWLASIGVGICAAPLVGLIAGTAAVLCAEWLRVPQREGAAGFFAVGMALLGVIVGFILGIAFARGLLQTTPTFGKSLGLTVGSCSAVAVFVACLVRLAADLPPKIDGQRLELAIELRCPAEVNLPTRQDSTLAYATFVRLADGDTRGYAGLDLKNVRDEGGHKIVPALLDIETSAAKKLLKVQLGEHRDLLFALGFSSIPHDNDFQWSNWIDAAYKQNETPDTTGSGFALRYQVRKIEPPPPPPTREAVEAAADAKQEAEFRALAPDASLAEYLIYTRYGVPQPRIDAAVKTIMARPHFVAELSHEMLHGAHESSRDALRVLEHMREPPRELAAGVAAVGGQIAQSLRELAATPPPDEGYAYGSDLSTRFSAWMVATRALQSKAGVDFVPQLQEIIAPARERQSSHTIRIDIVRVASYYLQQWAGIEPLPTDPPPR